MQTTTTLQQQLHQALVTAGLAPDSTPTVIRLLPDAGQHVLLTALNDNPDALREYASAFIGGVAFQLRTTHANADVIRAIFLAAVTR